MLDIEKLQSIILSGTQPNESRSDAVVIPLGSKLESLEATLEKHRPQPTRMRGTYSTSDIDEFVAYCSDQATSASRVFLDPDSLQAVCRINHGDEEDPAWGDYSAALTLKKTPEYEALLGALQSPLSQDDLVDYILDWAPILTFLGAEIGGEGLPHESMPLAVAISLLRNLTVKGTAVSNHQQTETSRERSLLESAAVTSDPPKSVFVDCIPYEGLSERTLPVRLVYKPTDPPMIQLRLVGAERLALEIAREFRDTLVRRLLAIQEDSAKVDLTRRIHIGRYR